MLRKICKIGNSQGVSIPKDIINELHLAAGSEVDINLDKDTARIIIEPVPQKTPHETIKPEFASQVNDFIEKYRPALKALAK